MKLNKYEKIITGIIAIIILYSGLLALTDINHSNDSTILIL